MQWFYNLLCAIGLHSWKRHIDHTTGNFDEWVRVKVCLNCGAEFVQATRSGPWITWDQYYQHLGLKRN